jgi:peptidoglycan lytic transglycosylase
MDIKKYPWFFPLLFALFFLSSCASFDSERYSEPYDDSGYAIASWYGREFHGRRTSSGQPFNMHAYTCAHRTYPFGTRLKITNPANGKTVYCVVNDRGPSSKDRDIDLSYAAAKEIGLIGKGSAKVRIEYSGEDYGSPED